MKKKTKRQIIIPAACVLITATTLIVKKSRDNSVYDNEPEQKNPLEGKRVYFVHDENDAENADGVRGHLEASGNTTTEETLYQHYIKRGIDTILSFIGLIVLSPILGAISLAIVIDDPGPVLFTQKRVGQNKKFFKLHKFRSMKMSTPHDVPTHMLDNPEQYITRVGKFIRAHSLDELPQIWDIFIGNMSIIGPRPALWNQDILTSERDKYGANDIKPGLTGWAQINGRDELEIPVKAQFDGEYVNRVKNGGFKAFLFDCKCFLGTIFSVARSEGGVEGGTGTMHHYLREGVPSEDPDTVLGCDLELIADDSADKKVLITGAGSYIGESVKRYATEHYPNLDIETIDMIDGSWRKADFSSFDCIYHVAGIAHADVGNVTDEVKEKYYAVNTDLAIEVANKAKADDVKQFIFMSSMIIYGDSSPFGKEKTIDRNTRPEPANFYGDSKWQADKGVRALADKNFRVAVLRPPMIYGKGSKGNYPTLAKLARKLPVFPDVDNQRSMLYIENLCEFICKLIMTGEGGIYFPQNEEYTKTSHMVSEIGRVTDNKIRVTPWMNLPVAIAAHVPGKISGLVNKAFGNSCYNQNLSKYTFDYQKYNLKESIELTEGFGKKKDRYKKHILLISQYFYPETFRVNDMAAEWVKRGYKVTVLTGIPNYPMGEFFEGYGYLHKRREIWKGIEIIRIPLIARGNNSNKLINAAGMAANYLSFAAAGKLWVKTHNVGADLVFTFEVSPMTQALIGVWYGERYKVPTYLYVQDLWPENVETVTGIHNKAIIGPIDKMVDYIYEKTDKIFTTSPSFVNSIVNRKKGVSADKVHYWPQYAEDFYRPLPKDSTELVPEDSCFKIAFTGNIGTAQGLDVLPKTADLLRDEKVKFIIVGDGRYQAELERKISELQVGEKFIMIPRVPAEKIPYILSSCDAGFISFNKTPLWEMTVPAKLQSYMACGKAIVASASGETRRIIEEAECGICCELGNPQALAEGIRALIQQDTAKMGRNARRYFEDNFDKKKLMDIMDEYIG